MKNEANWGERMAFSMKFVLGHCDVILLPGCQVAADPDTEEMVLYAGPGSL